MALLKLDGANLDTQTNSENSHEFEILDLNGKETGVFFTIVGAEADRVRKYQSKMLRQAQERESREKRTGKFEPMTLDQLEDIAIDAALVRTVGWRGVSLDGEEELPFNPENAKFVFKRFRLIREQVIEQSDDLGNFGKA